MEQQNVIYLVGQYLSGQLTAPQREELFAWLESEENRAAFVNIVTPLMLAGEEKEEYSPAKWDAVLQSVLLADKTPALDETMATTLDETMAPAMAPTLAPIRRLPRRRAVWTVAASVLILAAAGAYWQYAQHAGTQRPAPIAKHDLPPGGNKAILTLSSGARVILDSAAEDTVLTEGSDIVANAGGRLAYNTGSSPAAETAAGETVYNTLTTPRGGQYQVTLPDGTRVWLNAASSIRYPTGFSGTDRVVTITGEAYLEVAHLPHRPFKVKVGGTTIEDLGTHFNINAYADEPSRKVTLLEGSVKINSRILSPGQQATMDQNGQQITVQKVETDQVVSWVKGKLSMDSLDVSAIMRQVSRWYDVDVVYEGPVPKGRFWGVINRNVQLSSVLDVMTNNGINVRLDNKKIIVSNK